MGAVYEARHTLVGKRCAVKLLLPDLAGEQEVVQRMLREAQAAAAIGHPNIVDTFDFGVAPDGACYLVMEYLEGRSLGDLIDERHTLDLEVAAAIIDQVLAALEAAHAKGIVHRDLKPDNIFIARSPRGGEEVKLLDFGISKVQAAQADDMKLTRTGAVLGTPYYMSPEQAEGAREVDHRTDLWAVGVILYEALTGEVPFRGKTYNQVILQLVMKDPAPPLDLVPGLSEAAEAVILRALEKDPARRWASAAALREALRACVPALAPREAPAPSTLVPGLLDGPGSPGPMAGQVGTGAGASLATSKTEMAGTSGSSASFAGPAPASARAAASAADSQVSRAGEPAAAPVGEPSALDHTLAPVADLGRQSALHLPRPGRKRFAVVTGAVAALAVSAVILFFALSGGRGERKPPPADVATSSKTFAGAPQPDARPGGSVTATPLPMRRASGAPMQALLSIELAGLPAGATVELDGRPARPPLRLSADGERHVLEVTARGYHPYTKRFVARAGLRSLTLRPRRRGSHRALPRDRPTTRPMTRPMRRPAMRPPAMRPNFLDLK